MTFIRSLFRVTHVYDDDSASAERVGDMSNTDRLHKKYHVERTDGRDMGPYFILEYASDRHARKALAAYADSCQEDKPELAADIRATIAGYLP